MQIKRPATPSVGEVRPAAAPGQGVDDARRAGEAIASPSPPSKGTGGPTETGGTSKQIQAAIGAAAASTASAAAAGSAHAPKTIASAPRGVHLTAWKETRVEGLRVVENVRPGDVLATRVAGKSFRPTLVGRMDTAPEKLALVDAFVTALCARHTGDTALVGSSTTAPGSPDLLANVIAGRDDVPMVRFNFADYLVEGGKLAEGARPAHIVDDRARQAFTAAPHFAVPTAAAYGDALAVVSNVAIVMGGRADALREIKNAVDAGHAVLLLDVPGHPDAGHAWDADRTVNGAPAPRTDDAIKYLRHQLHMLDDGLPLHPDFGGVTRDWLVDNRARIGELVRFVELTDPVDAAVQVADRHLATIAAC